MNAVTNPGERFAFIHEPLGESFYLHVFGEVDIASVDEFEESIKATAANNGPIVIDLEPCSYIDSTGLAVLIRAFKLYGARLGILLPTEGPVRRVFQITSLLDVLPILSHLP